MNSALRHNRDFLTGLLLLVIGALTVAIAGDYPMGAAARMGPGYFPTVLGAILCMFGIYILARGIRTGEQVKGQWAWKPLALITLSIVLFGFLMERFGIVPALVAVFFASALAGHEFRFRETLVLTLVMGAFAVGVFFYGLKLPYSLFGW